MHGEMMPMEGLRVRIDQVVHMPGLDAPPDKPHPFVYFITILNEGDETVMLKGRKWVVREAGGEVTVVEGEGIVGQNPIIAPGGMFSYNSYHVVARNAVVAGAFFGELPDGRRVYVRIPEFRLAVP